MRNGVATTLVLLALVIGGVVGYMANSTPPVKITTTLTTLASCAETLSYPQNNQTTLPNGTEIFVYSDPVFLANPGSSMTICVNFETFQGSNQTESSSLNPTAYGWGVNRSIVPINGIALTPIPKNITVSPGQTADVQYLVEISRNSTGKYGLNMVGCMLFPLAIGNESSQFKSSDFPQFPRHGCRSPYLQATIVGYSGEKVGFIRTEGRYTPSIMVSRVTVHAFPNAQGIENITARMHIRSFAQPFTIGLSLDGSYTREFKGNPDLSTVYTNDFCNWSVLNTSAFSSMISWPFQEGLSGFKTAHAPETTIPANSNATYSISILVDGHVSNNTAIDLTLFARQPGSVLYVARWVTVLAYFPVNISGYSQNISASCSSTYGE